MQAKIPKEFTLVLPVRGDTVLLGYKTEKIGVNLWNGYGGKVEHGETVVQAAVRELHEESALMVDPADLEKVGVAEFRNADSSGTIETARMHIFIARTWTGVAQETKTMITPTWFLIDELPLEKMIQGDRIWMPEVLKGKKLRIEATYGPLQQELIGKVRLREVQRFEKDHEVKLKNDLS